MGNILENFVAKSTKKFEFHIPSSKTVKINNLFTGLYVLYACFIKSLNYKK
jgi:hypothetical protein